jgi:hypothetical protein
MVGVPQIPVATPELCFGNERIWSGALLVHFNLQMGLSGCD